MSMDEDLELDLPQALSKRERAEAMAKALGEAARRTRLSKKNKLHLATGQSGGRRDERLYRRIKRLSFLFLFLLPSLTVAIYYAFVASDQFVSETRFTLRGGLPPKLDTIGELTGLPPALEMQDTHVILNYLLSRALIEQVDKSVDFRKVYSKPSIDIWDRMDATQSIEKIVKYWKSMVDISLHMPGGIVILSVRAFSADDANRLANAILQACEQLVNEMNDRMIRDTLAVSEAERLRSERNLAAARARLETSRNTEGLLSADKTAEGLSGLLLQVKTQLGEMQQEYNAQLRYVADDAPQIRNLRVRIEAANEEVKALQSHLTGSAAQDGSMPLTNAMSNLEYLNLENVIAEKIYASSLALLEHARLATESRLLYLNVFVKPTLAQEADHWQRKFPIILFTLADFVCWSIFILVIRILFRKGLLRLALNKRLEA